MNLSKMCSESSAQALSQRNGDTAGWWLER